MFSLENLKEMFLKDFIIMLSMWRTTIEYSIKHVFGFNKPRFLQFLLPLEMLLLLEQTGYLTTCMVMKLQLLSFMHKELAWNHK